MNVTMTHNDSELTVAIEGRLDTLTAPELEEQLEPELDEAEKLTFDMEGLEYISSAGLRVLLTAVHVMQDKGEEVYVKNVRPEVLDVFEVTGFSDFLNII
ncbi:MAG: STAS domain-containing protein [Ruminococcus sp.]|nr:STAS domain-containing protein [Ruminococcus sp.]